MTRTAHYIGPVRVPGWLYSALTVLRRHPAPEGWQDTVLRWHGRAHDAEAVVDRARAALADVLRCQDIADPSERMRCGMCCNDHFDDLAKALAPAPAQTTAAHTARAEDERER